MIRSLAVNPLVFTKHSDAAPRQSGWTALVVRIDPQRWKLLHQLIDYGWHRWRWRLWLRVGYADASCESYDVRTSDHQQLPRTPLTFHRAPPRSGPAAKFRRYL